MTVSRNLIVFAALNGALAVALGAFAAHGAGPQIKTLLTTGAQYQIVHAVFAFACAQWTGGGGLARLAGWLGSIGGLIFCLALAAIAFLGVPAFGAVAPIGGLLMIAGWLCLAFTASRSRS
ncbi:uncharacterized membrane protein YgdD (TMEM256/DUF423 family) [Brevundimonas vesicularis]|uniref:Uncharacterized membrane protein YgdD (TMEM256/DUF423 family) n=1 Tax=Brevundimonas vesicularis TaxID=41276 RepID=A0A7W9FSL6_BREVE|nr:DUF423 domain-containing protein [Brevundimonas vesicularis]MBB5770797.1 uncharacterized membrane protein YgdD (TMEM256/DUF423 family) [Brevundimonas vesicularis]